MIDPDLISSKLLAHRTELERFQVKELWVFGSAARGEKEASDIDLLVEFTVSPGLVGFVELKEFLESVLGAPVDLVSKRGCNERFFQAISADLRHVA